MLNKTYKLLINNDSDNSTCLSSAEILIIDLALISLKLCDWLNLVLYYEVEPEE